MHLSEIKIIDLRHSTWDKETSDPKKGKYNFTKKALINYSKDDAIRPPWKFAWNLQSEYAYQDWKNKWPGTEFVTVKDEYFPEGAVLGADGLWHFKDAVLMKIPLLAYVQQRRREIAASEKTPENIRRGFKEETRAYGMDISDEELDIALGAR